MLGIFGQWNVSTKEHVKSEQKLRMFCLEIIVFLLLMLTEIPLWGKEINMMMRIMMIWCDYRHYLNEFYIFTFWGESPDLIF